MMIGFESILVHHTISSGLWTINEINETNKISNRHNLEETIDVFYRKRNAKSSENNIEINSFKSSLDDPISVLIQWFSLQMDSFRWINIVNEVKWIYDEKQNNFRICLISLIDSFVTFMRSLNDNFDIRFLEVIIAINWSL